MRRRNVPDGPSNTLPAGEFHAVCTNGASFPVVYALVGDKSYATYKTVLDAVQRHADTMGLGNVFSRGTLKSLSISRLR